MSPLPSIAQARTRLGALAQDAMQSLPAQLRHTATVNLFGLLQVPMITFCLPRVVRLDDGGCEIMVPLRRRTKNHFNSMYFGALAIGADVAGGFLVRHHIERSGAPLALIFKSFSAQFLKRPEGNVVTCCHQGSEVAALVARALNSTERCELPLELTAFVDGHRDGGPVARYSLEVSIKRRRS